MVFILIICFERERESEREKLCYVLCLFIILF